eukprot:749613-Hanusia_phi.AAC.3
MEEGSSEGGGGGGGGGYGKERGGERMEGERGREEGRRGRERGGKERGEGCLRRFLRFLDLQLHELCGMAAANGIEGAAGCVARRLKWEG